jgi:hypothetical protein
MTSALVPASISIDSYQHAAVEYTPYLLILHAGARSQSRGIRAKQREAARSSAKDRRWGFPIRAPRLAT